MENVLKYLMELQKVDARLHVLEGIRGDLPQQISNLEKEIKSAREVEKKKEEELQTHQKERGITEMDLKELEERKKKYQSQLYEVKSNREYDAVTMELENVKQTMSNQESRILELIDLEEKTKAELGAQKQHLSELENRAQSRKKELQGRMAETEKDEIALKDQKYKIQRNLDARVLAAYDRILKAKKGLAVVPVVRNACGGCFKTLPPQKILEIRTMNQLRLCEVCGRILIWDEAESEQTE